MRQNFDRLAIATTRWVLVGVAVAMATTACSHPHASAADAHAAEPTPDAIFAHYFRAIGGRDRLEHIESRHMWGVYSEGTLTAKTDMVWKRLMWRRVEVHAPGFDYSQRVDCKN